jgi:putative acetyltransferase
VLMRAYQHADLNDVVRCFTESVRVIAARHYDAQQVDTWAPVDADLVSWRERLSHSGVFVADVQGGVAGFVRVEPSGLIDQIYVHPAHVRRGIGTELLCAGCAWAVANGAKRFEANVSFAARPFFEAAGFRVEREQSVEYKSVAFSNFRMVKAGPSERSRIGR